MADNFVYHLSKCGTFYSIPTKCWYMAYVLLASILPVFNDLTFPVFNELCPFVAE